MCHDNFSPSFKNSCKTNKLSETFRARNSFSLLIFRGHYQGLILICSPVRQANHRHGIVANIVVLVELSDLRGLFQLKWLWFFDLQTPGKVSLEDHVPNSVAMQVSSGKPNHSPPCLWWIECICFQMHTGSEGLGWVQRWWSWSLACWMPHLSPTALKKSRTCLCC